MSKERVEGYESFTNEDAERALNGPQSEDLPKNIEELEAAIQDVLAESISEEIIEAGKDLSFFNLNKTLRKPFERVWEAKKLRPIPDWDIDDLVTKIIKRRVLGLTGVNSNKGLECNVVTARLRAPLLTRFQSVKDLEQNRTSYEVLKSKNPIISLVELAGGVTRDVLRISEEFMKLEEMIKEGQTLDDIISDQIYADNQYAHLAFLILIEEQSGAIKTPQELKKAGKLDQVDKDYLVNFFNSAQEVKYRMTIEKTLKEGGKYPDLLNIDSKDFSLPEKWYFPYYKDEMDRDRIIGSEIRIAINNGILKGDTYREIAQNFDAPLSLILEAVSDYD